MKLDRQSGSKSKRSNSHQPQETSNQKPATRTQKPATSNQNPENKRGGEAPAFQEPLPPQKSPAIRPARRISRPA
jgi:hypothetical protein